MHPTRHTLASAYELRQVVDGVIDRRSCRASKAFDGGRAHFAALQVVLTASAAAVKRANELVDFVYNPEAIDLLLQCWSKVENGQGQVVFLSGEAGSGKTWLTSVLQECLAAESHTRLRYFCSPHHADSALHPIIDQLERAQGLRATTQAR